MGMSKCAYLSDISPWWTMERQETALADVLPGATIYRDHLDARARRAHDPASLQARAGLLRPTQALARDETIYVASLAILAWSEDDMRAVLNAIASRGAKLVSSEGIDSDSLEAWRQAKRQSRLEGAALRGSAVSAERRKAASLAGVALIKPFWPLPSKEYPTASLCEKSGLSLNTVKAHLGSRPIAQYNHRMKIARRRRKEHA